MLIDAFMKFACAWLLSLTMGCAGQLSAFDSSDDGGSGRRDGSALKADGGLKTDGIESVADNAAGGDLGSNADAATAPPSGMMLIAAGAFTMGDQNGDSTATDGEQPTHSVSVGTFFLEENLVSYTLWKQVYQWATAHGYKFSHAGNAPGPDHPVSAVSWFDAVKWCNARAEMEGLAPVYFTDTGHTQIYRTGEVAIDASNLNWGASGYRLPTEAEWEKAARGGAAGQRFPLGDTISLKQAQYSTKPSHASYDLQKDDGVPCASNSAETSCETVTASGSAPVGSFAPNGYGLRDMAGNLLEWIWDRYSATYYASSPASDPQGPETGGLRTVRGGGWMDHADALRCAARDHRGPALFGADVGFRCARSN